MHRGSNSSLGITFPTPTLLIFPMPDSQPTLLAVGAHPDDIEFGCGGILLAEAERGCAIALCVCSRGEAGTNGTPSEREAEARQAAKVIGATIEFLDFGGDCRLD